MTHFPDLSQDTLLEKIDEKFNALIIFTDAPILESLKKTNLYNSVNYILDGQLALSKNQDNIPHEFHLYCSSQFSKDFFVLLITNKLGRSEKFITQLSDTVDLILKKAKDQNQILVLNSSPFVQKALNSQFSSITWDFQTLS